MSTETPITIVSAYFQISSKYPHLDYVIWMQNMLENIETPMIIFCDEASQHLIKEFRGSKPMILICTKIEEFYVYKYDTLWKHHNESLELYKNHNHNYLLYLIWAEKTNFLKKAASLDPFSSKYFMWCDIGYFRNTENHLPMDKLRNFPDMAKIVKYSNDGKSIISLIIAYPSPSNTIDVKIGGGMFIIPKSVVNKWWYAFYTTLESDFFDKNIFAGDDQQVMHITLAKGSEFGMPIMHGIKINDYYHLHRLIA